MEAYQPLNTYSFCKTNRKQEREVRSNKAEVKTISKNMFYKYLISVVAILVIVVATVFVKIEASEPISTVPANGEIKIVVGTGDTLWKLANTYYGDIADTGYVVYLIKERNGLKDTIYPGQAIILPAIE